MKKISCVIVNYNDADTTIEQLERIGGYHCFDSIIIVDNHSDDGSKQKLKEYIHGNMILVESGINGGYGAGNNLGILYANEMLHSTHVLIANPDTVFSEECVNALYNCMIRHEQVGIAAPVMLQKDKSQAVAWPLRSWFHELLEMGPVCRRVFKNVLNYPNGYTEFDQENNNIAYVGAVPGSLLMVDVRKIMECGGYDEAVFLYCEENILGYNMREAGYKTVLLRNRSYEHRHSVSIAKSFREMADRQKLRNKSTMQYFRYYLGINVFQELFSILFFNIILLEIFIYENILKK